MQMFLPVSGEIFAGKLRYLRHRFCTFTSVKHCYLAVLIVSLAALVTETFAQGISGSNQREIAGQIVNKEDGEPVPFVHIVNRTIQQGTASDMDGRFSIEISENDTLHFSSVGFEELVFTASDTTLKKGYLTIALSPRVVELDQVDVFAFKNAASLKRHILSMEVPEKAEEIKIPGAYEGPRRPVKPGLDLSNGIGFSGPFSMIQGLFSKKAKEKREYRNVLEDYSRQKLIADKFNKELVEEVTGLKDHALDDFMIYCNQKISDEFILKSNEYEIIVALNRCYADFVRNQ